MSEWKEMSNAPKHEPIWVTDEVGVWLVIWNGSIGWVDEAGEYRGGGVWEALFFDEWLATDDVTAWAALITPDPPKKRARK